MDEPISSKSQYRLSHSTELQGLRALAVTTVLLYHADNALLPGGFVGVDIFFVLSGFLIGRKLLAELDETGRINLIAFTTGRVKRLLPNALLTLLAVAIASFFLLPPYRLEMIGSDIWAAGLFYSNFHFASNAVDYLQIGTPPSPVLHFWSLSIEEQFYIGLPLLLFAASKVNPCRRLQIAICLIIGICIASFILGLLERRAINVQRIQLGGNSSSTPEV